MPSLISRVPRFSAFRQGLILASVVLAAFFVAIIHSSPTVHASGTTKSVRVLRADRVSDFVVSPDPTVLQAGQPPLTVPDSAGRLMVLLFDTTALPQDLLDNAVTSSLAFVDKDMVAAVMVSIVTLSTRLNVVSDFTSDREALHNALSSPLLQSAAQTAAGAADATASSDVRLRALTTLCQTLAPLTQRKALMYFSGGLTGAGAADNQTELNTATNTCRRANVLIYPVDARGLAAIVAGSDRNGGNLRNGRPTVQ